MSLGAQRKNSRFLNFDPMLSKSALRLIAFYLPQYHPIAENDKWWGEGFTDWHNVAKAKPLFRGHQQPHVPGELGYYDLRDPGARTAQAALAREHGVFGFCYYHFWFNGKRLLERPLQEVLSSGQPDFPFCLCWANENWTRVWDGGDREVIVAQTYSRDDDRAHIKNLIPAFRDARYIRINGKALFLVYRAEELPDPVRTTDIWREEAHRSGIGDLFLARVESFVAGVDPRSIGFDAAVEFAPEWRKVGRHHRRERNPYRFFAKMGLFEDAYRKHRIVRYEVLADDMLARELPGYPFFRCVTPGFDNSARRSEGAAILVHGTPEIYENWLNQVARETCERYQGEERIVFINAWNEWAEGNHLEPDEKRGRAYLEATRRVVEKLR